MRLLTFLCFSVTHFLSLHALDLMAPSSGLLLPEIELHLELGYAVSQSSIGIQKEGVSLATPIQLTAEIAILFVETPQMVLHL